MDWVSDKNHTKIPYTTDENGIMMIVQMQQKHDRQIVD